ncbi:Protein of unknown function [Weissella confusa LBAE C39-2]|nr:Protein of unknown function [Weissella confusa LBAE C39-2]
MVGGAANASELWLKQIRYVLFWSVSIESVPTDFR